MKKVTGWISVRQLGGYNFKFYVNDNATDEDIQKIIDEVCEVSKYYDVEEGYEEYTKVAYRKK